MLLFRIFLLLGLAALSPLTVVAQERVASGNLNTEANWGALRNLAELANTKAQTASILAEAIKACGMKDMIYAPQTAGADGSGCKKISSSPKTRVVTASVTAFRWPGAAAMCPAGTLVVGGGGTCSSSIGWMFLNNSYPYGNGWYASCDTEQKVTASITTYAVCLSAQ